MNLWGLLVLRLDKIVLWDMLPKFLKTVTALSCKTVVFTTCLLERRHIKKVNLLC